MTPERLSIVFIVNFGHISFLFSGVFVVDFGQTNNFCIPPYQLINAEITYCCDYWQMDKNLSEREAYKKRL